MEIYNEMVNYLRMTQDELDALNIINNTHYCDGDSIHESFNVNNGKYQSICDSADALYIIIGN